MRGLPGVIALIGCGAVLAATAATGAAETIDLEAYGRCSGAVRSDAPPGPEAIADCQTAARQGVTGAQYLLAVLLIRQSPSAPPLEAVQWLEKAVAAGHPPAANTLADLYLRDPQPAKRELGRQLLVFAICSGYPPAEAAGVKRGIKRAELNCSAAQRPDFTGDWSGKLSWISPVRQDSLELRISVSATGVKVYGRSGNDWSEVKPGRFEARQIDDSLMITTLDSGWDLDGKWVESWTLHLLRVGPREARASFLRTINNVYAPATSAIKTFVGTAEGTMTRN